MDGFNVPSLENKLQMIEQMTERNNTRNSIQQSTAQVIDISRGQEPKMPEGYSINEYGEIIRPNGIESNITLDTNIPTFTPPNSNTRQDQNNLSFKQRIAQLLQKNDLLMNLPFVEKFVNNQLNLLPPPQQQQNQISTPHITRTKEDFINQLTGFGKYQSLDTKLPPIQRMSDPERLANMRRKMEQGQQSKNDDELNR